MRALLQGAMLFFICLTTLVASTCAPNSGKRFSCAKQPGDLKLYEIQGLPLFIDHVNLRDDFKIVPKHVAPGEFLGRCIPYPETISDNYQSEIVKSKQLYQNGDCQGASRILKNAIEKEPENPFVLEAYARALYRCNERKKSYVYYERLINQLDSNPRAVDPQGITSVVLDCWFTEAYWKYATLLLDKGKWGSAAFEINRFLALGAGPRRCEHQPAICVQAYAYLTESYYEMGKFREAKYFAHQALCLEPRNKYVQHFLEKMK